MTGVRLAVAASCACIALLALALAVDVVVVARGVDDDDLRFESAPRRGGQLWDRLGVLPGSVTERVLGIDDDLAYRRVAAAYARVQPSDARTSSAGFDTEIQSRRGQAQLELTRASQAETDDGRRSRLLTFLGVLPLDRVITEGDERAGVLRTSIGLFQTAVEADPQNADAKLNLELLLRDALATALPPNAPGGHPAGGPRSGPGGVGSSGGY